MVRGQRRDTSRRSQCVAATLGVGLSQSPLSPLSVHMDSSRLHTPSATRLGRGGRKSPPKRQEKRTKTKTKGKEAHNKAHEGQKRLEALRVQHPRGGLGGRRGTRDGRQRGKKKKKDTGRRRESKQRNSCHQPESMSVAPGVTFPGVGLRGLVFFFFSEFGLGCPDLPPPWNVPAGCPCLRPSGRVESLCEGSGQGAEKTHESRSQ